MKVTFLKGENAGMTFEYSQTGITIGRDPDNVICLETGRVSRYHAIISCISGTWTISDLNSTNGIKVNSIKIASSVLKNGDQVTVGEHVFSISDIENSKSEEQEDVLKKFKAPLFSQPAKENKPVGNKEDKPAGKRLFSNRLYYTIVACIAVMGITTAVKIFSNSPAPKNLSDTADNDEQIEIIIFERVKYSDNNVFRFSMSSKGEETVFTIDDAATMRHSKPIVFKNPPGLELLKNQINNTGIFKNKLEIPLNINIISYSLTISF